MPTPSMTRFRLMVASVVVLLLLSTGSRGLCALQRPKFMVVDSAHPSDAVLRAYLRSLSFLSDHISSDTRMLDAAHTNQIVRVEPAADNNKLNAAQLRRGGRVLGRVVNRGADSIPRFGIPPKGKAYVWIQYVREVWRGVLISSDSLGAITGRSPVTVRPERYDHPGRVLQPMARFFSDSITLMVLAPCFPGCLPYGWCRADSLHTAVWPRAEATKP